jgi:hypothetical protein
VKILECLGAQGGSAKAFVISADSVMLLFAFPIRILQASRDRFKTADRR